MMTEAGVDLDAVMLYEADRAQYEQLVKDWNAYALGEAVNVLVGDVVDWRLHQKTVDPPGPMEAFDRATNAAGLICGNGSAAGVFWHDLKRLLSGYKGPYPAREWALAGAAAFSDVRAKAGVLACSVELVAPQAVSKGQTFGCEVRVVNLSEKALRDLAVSIPATQGLAIAGPRTINFGELPARTGTWFQFELKPSSSLRSRKGKAMLAAVCRWQGGKKREQAVAFRYVAVRASTG